MGILGEHTRGLSMSTVNGTHVDWVSGYTLPARGGGKVIDVITLPLVRSLTFRAILASCAKALES